MLSKSGFSGWLRLDPERPGSSEPCFAIIGLGFAADSRVA